MRKHPAALSCASKSSGSRRPASISALRALIEGARSRIESSKVFASVVIELLRGPIYKQKRPSRTTRPFRVDKISRLRRLLGLLGARVAVAFCPLSARRALSLVTRFVATRARDDIAGSQHLDKLAHCRRQLAAALVDDRERAQESA